MSDRHLQRLVEPVEIRGTALTERARCGRCGSDLFASAVVHVAPDGGVLCSACLRRAGVTVRDGRSHWRPQ